MCCYNMALHDVHQVPSADFGGMKLAKPSQICQVGDCQLPNDIIRWHSMLGALEHKIL